MSQPLDLVHLSRRTLGDRTLEREVLSLFARQLDIYMDRLRDAADCRARQEAAHALVGSARAVGAFDVAREAKAIEQDPVGDCGRLDREAAEAGAFLKALL